MKNLLKIFTITLFGSMSILIILLTSIQIISFNKNYYSWHYKKYQIMNTTNISFNDLMIITDKMIKYLDNKQDNLDIKVKINGKVDEVFESKEKIHMKDVKDLFVIAKYFRNISVFIMLIILILFYRYKKRYFFNILKSIQLSCIISLVMIIFLSIIISTNFNHYFNMFHEIFFSNDLWVLNPETDILINMVPQSFFINTSFLILLLFVLMTVSSIIIIQKIIKIKHT